MWGIDTGDFNCSDSSDVQRFLTGECFPALSKCDIFGKTIYKEIDLAASDHYGLVVEIE